MDLLSESALDFVNILRLGAGMSAQNDDPQLVIKPRQSLPAGWYRFEAEILTETGDQPQLFFDFGHGFSEPMSVRLPRQAGNVHALTVKLPHPALLLRLDPTNAPGDFLVSRFVAEPVYGARLLRCLAGHALALLRSQPLAFLHRLPIYIDALDKPLLLQLTDPRLRGPETSAVTYRQWIARSDFDLRRGEGALRAEIAKLARRPLISVVMPVYDTPARFLREAIESVFGQVYENWQLCIADDCSSLPHVRAILTEYAVRDSRVRIVFRDENGHISHATNSAFELAEGEWVALLDHDDVLRPHALAEVALEIGRHPDAQLIYSDEDKLDRRGNREHPYFKPDFSRELFRSQNYLNHLTVHRSANIRAVGGWQPGYEGSQDYDLNLRVIERIDQATIRHIPKILYHWRATEGSTAASASEKTYAFAAGLRALQDHIARTGLNAEVEAAPGAIFYRMRFAVPQPAPLVSLIIPTRDRAGLLRACVGSILKKTGYARYEIIIVDNGSVEQETHLLFNELQRRSNIRILRFDGPFNYSEINNFAVAQAGGMIVGLINNDTEVISPGWLDEMVSWACQADVGCVGAKLLYRDGAVQHAGVILGIGGVASHAHHRLPRQAAGHFGRAVVHGNFSAVTGACLVVRKSIYEEVGGLDARNLAVAFNDVDFSLRVREAGYVNVWTPYAELYHFESVSRGRDDSGEQRERFVREVGYMQRRWQDALADDPYYSPNLTRARADFTPSLQR